MYRQASIMQEEEEEEVLMYRQISEEVPMYRYLMYRYTVKENKFMCE